MDEQLRALVGRLTYLADGEERIPAVVALHDHARASNGLGSFLGQDRSRSLATMFLSEDAEHLSPEALHRTVVQVTTTLMDEENWQFAWVQLFAVLGNLPVYDDLADQLRAALRNTDFVALMQRHLTAGAFALHVASLQTVHRGDTNLGDYLAGELVRVAKLLSEGQDTALDAAKWGPDGLTTAARVQWRLVEATRAIALAPQRPSFEAMAAFAALVTAIADVWSVPAPVLRQVVQRLADQLPIAAAAELWPVLVRLRAG